MKTNTMTANIINNETTTIKFTLGKIVYNEGSTMPQLEVLGNNEVFGYLAPFRKYCFQVSGSIDGDMDLGASGNVDLQKLVDILNTVDHQTLVETFRGMAMTALVKAVAQHGTLSVGSFHSTTEGKVRRWFNDTVEEFVNAVIDWMTTC